MREQWFIINNLLFLYIFVRNLNKTSNTTREPKCTITLRLQDLLQHFLKVTIFKKLFENKTIDHMSANPF
jgi:hypothetical protein